MNGLVTIGELETGLEAFATSLHIAKKGNLPISYRSGANTQKVFVIVTNEDSDAPIYPENRFSRTQNNRKYIQDAKRHDGLCRGSPWTS